MSGLPLEASITQTVWDLAEAAKTVRGMKWARVAELEMELDGKKIAKYRTTTKIYFDIEK